MEVVLDPTKVVDFNAIDVCALKIKVKYCVDDGVHMEQVRASTARGLPSLPIQLPLKITYEPIAVACSGPTLKNTWEELRKFTKIISCSGANDFLIERGIVPTYHMETDPRPHKSLFVAKPHPEVKYLIASCCHPKVFDSLEGAQVFIWHVLSTKDDSSLYREEDWILTGGSNVGLRAMVMARLLGHITVHVFGMDCSADAQAFHAIAHPNAPKDKARRIVKVGDRHFVTTEVYLEYARQFFWETLLLSDTHFTLHGDGLLQNLAAMKLSSFEYQQQRMAELQARGEKSLSIAYRKGNSGGEHSQAA